MSAQAPRDTTALKASEILEAYFRLDSATQKEVKEQVARLQQASLSGTEQARAEKQLAATLRAGARQAGPVVSRAERLSAARLEVRAEVEQTLAIFAATLARLMAERQLTQAHLAERLGVGQTAISMLLKRRCRPQRRTIGKLAEALGVPVDELWPGFNSGWRSGAM